MILPCINHFSSHFLLFHFFFSIGNHCHFSSVAWKEKQWWIKRVLRMVVPLFDHAACNEKEGDKIFQDH